MASLRQVFTAAGSRRAGLRAEPVRRTSERAIAERARARRAGDGVDRWPGSRPAGETGRRLDEGSF